jgi:hypothetical protein
MNMATKVKPVKRHKSAKRTDVPEKYILNPEYLEHHRKYSKEGFIDEIYAGTSLLLGGHGNPFAACEAARAELMAYFPEDYGAKIPEEGGWILVTNPPHTEIKVNRFSIWFAMPEVRPGRNGFTMHLARILTPEGNLWLWPHEYSVVQVEKYLEFVGEGFEINYFSQEAEIKTDALFYLMSRGIKRPVALRLLLPTLKSQTVCWLEAHEELQGLFQR